MGRYIAPAISAFTTSMWIIQEVRLHGRGEVELCQERQSREQCMELLPKNLESISLLNNKISLAGQNDGSLKTIIQSGMNLY